MFSDRMQIQRLAIRPCPAHAVQSCQQSALSVAATTGSGGYFQHKSAILHDAHLIKKDRALREHPLPTIHYCARCAAAQPAPLAVPARRNNIFTPGRLFLVNKSGSKTLCARVTRCGALCHARCQQRRQKFRCRLVQQHMAPHDCHVILQVVAAADGGCYRHAGRSTSQHYGAVPLANAFVC